MYNSNCSAVSSKYWKNESVHVSRHSIWNEVSMQYFFFSTQQAGCEVKLTGTCPSFPLIMSLLFSVAHFSSWHAQVASFWAFTLVYNKKYVLKHQANLTTKQMSVWPKSLQYVWWMLHDKDYQHHQHLDCVKDINSSAGLEPHIYHIHIQN